MRTPFLAARSTICVGVSRPSEAVLWLWRSTLAVKRMLPVDPLDRDRATSPDVDFDQDTIQDHLRRRLFDGQASRHLSKEQPVGRRDLEAEDAVASAGHSGVAHIGGAFWQHL